MSMQKFLDNTGLGLLWDRIIALLAQKANSGDLANVATSGSYNDLQDKPTIPDIQIDGSSVVDNGIANIPVAGTDLGVVKIDTTYGIKTISGKLSIQNANNSDVKNGIDIYKPIVPIREHMATFYGLAKAAGDTTQSQSDNAVGTYTDGAKTAIQNMLGVPAASAIPTSVSQLTNDAGYLTSYTETDPTVPSWAKAQTKPTYTASEVGAPTVAEMNTAIGTAISNINSFDMAVVQELPTQDISTHTIYLVPKTGDTNDVYDEYVYINNAWEMIGNTQIDLSNYVQKNQYASAEVAGLIKTNPTYGLSVNNKTGLMSIIPATQGHIKTGTAAFEPITVNYQHISTFYGLAKAAGDTTQSQSDNEVGTYTTTAAAAIRSMLGAAASTDIPNVPVQDVQVNDTSVLQNGIANVPIATTSGYGVVMLGDSLTLGVTNKLILARASDAQVKNGGNTINAIVPSNQHHATFYGLAKAAGADLANEANITVGTYTTTAQTAIKTMLGVEEGLKVVRLI